MAIIYTVAAFGIGFLLTYFVIPPTIVIANEKRLFDEPNSRRLNKVAIPTIGGIAIFFGWVISSLACLEGNFVDGMQYLLVATLLMFFVGLKDDIMAINAWKKFAIQACAAIILVVLGDFKVVSAHGVFGMTIFSDWLSIPLSVLLILFLTNAINLIDGIDGLSSGLSIVIALSLGIGFCMVGSPGYAIICFALIGSLLAFLRFNLSRGKNKTFMGDTGSLVLGIFLSSAAIYLSNKITTEDMTIVSTPVIILAIFIVPVTDTLRVFFIRVMNKRSPFDPDMNHFHHILIKRGMTHIQGTCTLVAYTLLFILLAGFFSYLKMDVTISFFSILLLSFGAIAFITKAAIRSDKTS